MRSIAVNNDDGPDLGVSSGLAGLHFAAIVIASRMQSLWSIFQPKS